MRVKLYGGLLSLMLILASCTKEYDCAESQIRSAFIGYDQADLDTIFLRKFQAGDNFQHQIDQFVVTHNYKTQYLVSNDTTTVFVTDGINGIKAGYDWQVYIPTKNKTVAVLEILSEKKKIKCGSGIFSMDKFGCFCTNKVFSLQQDNQDITFSNSDTTLYTIYIHN